MKFRPVTSDEIQNGDDSGSYGGEFGLHSTCELTHFDDVATADLGKPLRQAGNVFVAYDSDDAKAGSLAVAAAGSRSHRRATKRWSASANCASSSLIYQARRHTHSLIGDAAVT